MNLHNRLSYNDLSRSCSSTGLYHKAILMGMYVFTPVVVFSRDQNKLAYEVAQMIGYDGLPGEDKKLLAFYKALDFPQFAMARPEQFFSKVGPYG